MGKEMGIYIERLEELSRDDLPKVGGKAANLGEMHNAGLPVPYAFVINTRAYREFVEKNGLGKKIQELLARTNVDDPSELEKNTEKLRSMIEGSPMPPEIREEILREYRDLSRRFGKEEEYVAVRSSATAEDVPDASFAGQQLTLLNVRGEEKILDAVKKCWASLFTSRATFYRAKKGFEHEKVLIALVVQKQLGMLGEEGYLQGRYKAGVGFTLHPSTGDRNKIVVEASWGQGEAVVSGAVTPDTYVLDKRTGEVVEKHISSKTRMSVVSPDGGLREREVSPEMAKRECLTKDELRQLWELALRLEEHYKTPQDFEWASEDGRVFLLQARPVTVFYEEKAVEVEVKHPPLLKGLPASPGAAIGKVKIVKSPQEASERLKKGDLLVTEMTSPDWVPYMKIASGIITTEGGITSHAAIVSRELGIPCIVGARDALRVLSEGMVVTLDSRKGLVYAGEVPELLAREKALEVSPEEVRGLKTRTKILMNLGEPDEIGRYKDLPFEGIGLMRVEFIIASWVGQHPNYLLEKGEGNLYTEKLAEGIARVAEAIYPRFVVVRFSDFKTNEYRELKGGERYEPTEANPMLGWRGVSRYISPQFEQAFRLECRAIRRVREKGLDNVWVMLPFVRTVWEVERCLQIMKEEGLTRGGTFKVWLMAEVPSIVFLAEEFSKFCDGFSIGSNDLTQLVLGVDRDSGILANMGYFDERNEAVKRAIEDLIRKAHSRGVTVSICGQAPSVYPEFTEFLVRSGIDSVSVNPDTVARTKLLVYQMEEKLKAGTKGRE
ncbi:MAG: phosphoenolpyruvate synthase [Candidatus Hadarchaeales archaeon]